MRDNWTPARAGRRWLADFALALALFWIAAFTLGGHRERAHAVPLPELQSAQARDGVAQTRHQTTHVASSMRVTREQKAAHTRAMVLLSLTFAALTALNLAFWRHLRRVYASPRRSVWRRD